MEDLHFLRLWDTYAPLLTQTQREITNLYFNCDLSLAEIAEEKGCSRQSVSDCLNKCRTQLEEYERKLHFVASVQELSLTQSLLSAAVNRWAQALLLAHPELSEELKELEAVLSRDYAEEAKALTIS